MKCDGHNSALVRRIDAAADTRATCEPLEARSRHSAESRLDLLLNLAANLARALREARALDDRH